MTRILLHGFGSAPLFFKPLIEMAAERYPDVEWAAILPTLHHLAMMQAVLGPERVLYLQDELRHEMQRPPDLLALRAYPRNIYRDIEADKEPIKIRRSGQQLANAFGTYRIYRAFLEKIRPTHILFGTIESHEGVILHGLGRELGIQTVVPTHLRNLGASFFSAEEGESLPPYACARECDREKAEAFIRTFHDQHIPADAAPPPAGPGELLMRPGKPFWTRLAGYARRLLREPDTCSWYDFESRVLNNLPWFRDAFWWLRSRKNERYHDIRTLDELPARFIYYPLQYSPESSINVPAPYYIDQRRVIDLIRFSMPNELTLVVKEHPACIEVRPGRFVRDLLRCAGVVVAHYAMDSRELVRRAELTISVTGTATLEAFLLGKASLVLGETFFAEFLGGVCGMDELPQRIRQCLGKRIANDTIRAAIAKILSACRPFVLRAPTPDGSDRTLDRANVAAFLDGLMEHIRLCQARVPAWAGSGGSTLGTVSAKPRYAS